MLLIKKKTANNNEKNRFYDQLQSINTAIDKNDKIKIVIGDFNGKVGSNNSCLIRIIDPHELRAVCNNNGKRLLHG